jgi:hypothetical protein
MAEPFTGWLTAAPGALVPAADAGAAARINISYSTNAGVIIEHHQVDGVVFGAAGASDARVFRGRFSYHEAQYITITGLSAPPNASGLRGLRLVSARARRGAFACSECRC